MMARSNLKMLGTAALSMWPAMNDDSIPTIGEHRGVGLHDHQSPKRLARVTREIDTVLGVNHITLLLEIAADVTWSPEARLTAAAKLRAMHELSVEKRTTKPKIDLLHLAACTVSLNSQKWRSPTHFASLLDPLRAPGTEGPVRREWPLERDG
jgi:hypothetical protein